MAGVAAVGIVGGVVLNQYLQAYIENNPQWYDIFKLNKYIRFEFQYTRTIDNLLSSHPKTYVSGTERENGREVPAIGTHYYYPEPLPKPSSSSKPSSNNGNDPFACIKTLFNTICKKLGMNTCEIKFQKMIDKNDQSKRKYYLASINKKDAIYLTNFKKQLDLSGSNTVRVSTIDTAQPVPVVQQLTKIVHPARPNQKQAIDLILDRYTKANNFNVKVYIHGDRAVGKSSMARILKKEMEARGTGYTYAGAKIAKDPRFVDNVVQLFDNVDPTVVGVNIETMILLHADPTSPVILVIDEIDVAFKHTLSSKNDYDPRLLHTRNEASFHAMLDAVGSYRNVIAIYTSEYSADEFLNDDKNYSDDALLDNEKKQAVKDRYQAFLRKGRFDMFIEMTGDAAIDEHLEYA